jgi:hypothetical protein
VLRARDRFGKPGVSTIMLAKRTLRLGIMAFGAIGCIALAVAHVSAKEHAAVPTAISAQPGSYPLDHEPRTLVAGAALPCGRHPLVSYRGEGIKYNTTARVHPALVGKLRGLEALVIELALKHYGRAPRRLVHLGTHNCRRIRTYPDWISEHTFGNAIDLAGFDFGPLPRPPRTQVASDMATRTQVASDMPRSLRAGFQVRIADHWTGRGKVGAYHSGFLRELATRLIDRRDLFRGILGPAWPGHHNHFHLDMAPYRVVEVFEATDAER